MKSNKVMIDGNAAAAHVGHATNEVIAIYPITPSSNMGEISDAKSAAGEKNIWGTIPSVTEMQSEGGASGAVHGALAAGALTTTFTASQGLLLMIPNMYKIAGELTPTAFHVSARSLACQALSIFGDHSDVMACRQTGFAMLCSGSIQEVMDLALIAQQSTLKARIPFLHFFDGFRTSHEIQKIDQIDFDQMRQMIDDELVWAHKQRALSPDRPQISGTSQNPDVYFQGRETVNKYYLATPAIVEETMRKFEKIVGRKYNLFDYVGAPDAEKIVIIMGSGAETVHETVEYLVSKAQKVGVLKVRLFRPFSNRHFMAAIPKTVKKIAVLDRTKEPGSLGEPLYMDVRTGVGEAMSDKYAPFADYPLIVGGRYGLGSKEFTPSMAKAVFDNLDAKEPKNHFTVGINDDVTNSSLTVDDSFIIPQEGLYTAMFFGLGSDGTVGANKNSIKIIGNLTDNYAQGYFVYDSKKAGAKTVSHLRFGKNIIRRPYLIRQADFVACHNPSFVEKYDMLANIKQGGTFLMTSMHSKDEVWDTLPQELQKQIIDKKLKFYCIDAISIAQKLGLGARINTIMQVAFFKISNIIQIEESVEAIKKAIEKSYGKKGQKIVDMNNAAVDAALSEVYEVNVPASVTSKTVMPPAVPSDAPQFVKEVIGEIIADRGDAIPVSKMPADGKFPSATTQYEKRNIAVDIPVWEHDVCIQCGQCSLVCPHAAIRVKNYDKKYLDNAPKTFKSTDSKGKEFVGMKWTVQVAPEDCTGCGNCVMICPAQQKDAEKKPTGKKAINMSPQEPLRLAERENYTHFLSIPNTDPALYNLNTVKGSQLTQPLFEYSGACAGCGETPYVKLLTQLFGDRALIGNATGCSSIYGGNLPTTPYSVRPDGRGPAWSNSLFEDNAEFAMGMRLAVDKFKEFAIEQLDAVAQKGCVEKAFADELRQAAIANDPSQVEIEKQRARVAKLKELCSKSKCAECSQLLSVADYLVRKSVWALGGDGWAYDIGYGGLDHVLASGKDVNVLVLDTEVYSNTGGQMSKSTPRAAVAQFAADGKPVAKKDLAMLAMTYGSIYVARIALGASPVQAVRAFAEAESYKGPSLILAYSHCIAHGYNLLNGYEHQKQAVASGYWPLYRYNPALKAEGKNPLQLDSKAPTVSFADYAYSENRYRTLKGSNPERAAELMKLATQDVAERFNLIQQLANLQCGQCQKTESKE
ncbi:MAG: pyruvate:ferredoxin (flavodoxin) oxidoreductase [Planctomycetes bacterium]|nr:pyruvate:ferredoxin (flavodoxin) oxidoreductase [Planctomycetota bacterium]MBU1517894.1 pyruvate:ferredoxin (flavodoxin) oxidoreductase [Planctomycetota bacterium]MBU2458313.1 pyruvate:ferredoxin (flavodoxin) oxidoreductase [Planctomycetota bacterium]MBU2596162.1 pyruvate:ferredoxin (flavodoxin) oxidoreductase [Planctomycetota bacterium]